MRKIVFSILFLFFTLHSFAQVDYLEPMKPISTYTGELGEYYRHVFSLLNAGLRKNPYACFVSIPSLSPEYAMSVEKREGRCCLVSNTLSRTYWQSEGSEVKVLRKSVFIRPLLYETLGRLFRLVTQQVQDLDGSTSGLDGVAYYFAATDDKGKVRVGRKWSPDKSSLMGRLVLVARSAYLLSQGESISEETLTIEAVSLLNDLEQRTKEFPNAHLNPIYIGIYQVGHRRLTGAGAVVDELPELLHTTPEKYVREHLVYPLNLLEKKLEGFALCEFSIDKHGVVKRPRILKATYPEFAQEALHLVKNMPSWKPALSANRPVETEYTLYVPFRLRFYVPH